MAYIFVHWRRCIGWNLLQNIYCLKFITSLITLSHFHIITSRSVWMQTILFRLHFPHVKCEIIKSMNMYWEYIISYMIYLHLWNTFTTIIKLLKAFSSMREYLVLPFAHIALVRRAEPSFSKYLPFCWAFPFHILFGWHVNYGSEFCCAVVTYASRNDLTVSNLITMQVVRINVEH